MAFKRPIATTSKWAQWRKHHSRGLNVGQRIGHRGIVEMKALRLELFGQDTLPGQQELLCHLPREQSRGGSWHAQL